MTQRLLSVVVATLLCASNSVAQVTPSNRVVEQGLTIDFQVRPYEQSARANRQLREGDTVMIGFDVRDAGSGNPVSGLNPAAWLAVTPRNGAAASSCTDQIKS